jgi:hypothetical protein
MSKSVEDLLRELETSGLVDVGTPPRPLTKSPRTPLVGGAKPTRTLPILLLVAIIAAIAGSLPFGSTALYPFALFITLIHECCHAIVATASGGVVDSLKIAGDTSGVTNISGGITALFAPAGYLGAALVGVGALLTPTRWARWVLAVLAIFPASALVLFHPASAFTGIWAGIFLVALLLGAWKLPPRWAAFVQVFLGLETGLNAFRDALNLVVLPGNSPIQIDAQLESQALFLPTEFWVILWTVFSVLMTLTAVAILARREGLWRRKSRVPVS